MKITINIALFHLKQLTTDYEFMLFCEHQSTKTKKVLRSTSLRNSFKKRIIQTSFSILLCILFMFSQIPPIWNVPVDLKRCLVHSGCKRGKSWQIFSVLIHRQWSILPMKCWTVRKRISSKGLGNKRSAIAKELFSFYKGMIADRQQTYLIFVLG